MKKTTLLIFQIVLLSSMYCVFAQTIPFPSPGHEGLSIKNISSFDLNEDKHLEIGLWLQTRVMYNFSNIPGPGGTGFDNTEYYDFFRQRFREGFNISLVDKEGSVKAGTYLQFEQRGGWGGSSPVVSDPRSLGPTMNPYNFLQSRGLRFGFVYYNYSEKLNISAGLLPLIDQVGRLLFDADWDFSVGGITMGGNLSTGNYRLGFVRLIDGVGAPNPNLINLNANMYLADYNHSFNSKFKTGVHLYGLNVPNGLQISVPSPDTVTWQNWLGLTTALKFSKLDINGLLLLNNGKINYQTNNGIAIKLEGITNLGKTKLSVYGIYTSGDKLDAQGNPMVNRRFITPYQIVGANGYWGYTHIFMPNGPSDVNDLNLEVGNKGAGLITIQAKLNFPVVQKRLQGQIFGGWFQADQERNSSKFMGIETGGMLTWHLADYLVLDLGISYADTGNFYGNSPRGLLEVFSRFQFTW
jgi:hypothetical protein